MGIRREEVGKNGFRQNLRENSSTYIHMYRYIILYTLRHVGGDATLVHMTSRRYIIHVFYILLYKLDFVPIPRIKFRGFFCFGFPPSVRPRGGYPILFVLTVIKTLGRIYQIFRLTGAGGNFLPFTRTYRCWANGRKRRFDNCSGEHGKSFRKINL